MPTVSETLRHVIESCGTSRYAISQETGIPASVLSRFVASGAGLRSQNLDKLCEHFGLVLVKKSGHAPAKKG